MKMEEQSDKLPVAVVFLTRNEEFHLPGALSHVMDWASEVFVVDSLSTDRTVPIAREAGAAVVQRRFTNFGDQWNFALDLPIRSPWTFKLDPDERLTPALLVELGELLAGTPKHVGYAMRRRLWFLGQPLHVTGKVLRLWQTGACRFSDVLVNERPLVDGTVGMLRGHLEHFDSRDLHHWYEKQNRYSTMEALMMHAGAETASETGRHRLKRWFFRLPFRYQLVWLHCMFVQGAWRDGAAGRAWAHLRQEVYRARALKALEMRLTGQATRLPAAPPGEMDPAVRDSELQRLMEARDATAGAVVGGDGPAFSIPQPLAPGRRHKTRARDAGAPAAVSTIGETPTSGA